MSRWGLRALPSYPWGPMGPHSAVVGIVPTREEAEEIRRAMPNGAHFEVVEVAP